MWDFSQQWNLQSEPSAVGFLNRMSGLVKMVVTVAFGSIVHTASFILYKVRT